MHAYLVTGGTQDSRLKEVEKLQDKLQSSPFDKAVLKPEGLSIGIDEVRNFQKQLILAPVGSPVNLGIIYEADTLTEPAQQALLKTLEEPPPRARIILETGFLASLLPTVVSRCQVVGLKSETEYGQETLSQGWKTLEKLTSQSLGQRLKSVEALVKNREEVESWLDLAIAASRQQMLDQYYQDASRNHLDYPVTQLLRNLLRAQIQLAANVNPKLVLDNVFLN